MQASQELLERMSATEHPHCLFCGKENPIGLKLGFQTRRPGSVIATVRCASLFESYPATLHGGVTSALLDEAMTHGLFSMGVTAVTGDMTVRFLEPVEIDCDAQVCATVERSSSPLHHVSAEMRQRGRLVARAKARFVDRKWAAAQWRASRREE